MKGKWEVHSSVADDIIDIIEVDKLGFFDTKIASMNMRDKSWRETLANAELMSTAPQLLEALKKSSTELFMAREFPPNRRRINNLLKAIENLIAEAEKED